MYSVKAKIKTLISEGFFHILIGNVLVKMVAFLSSIVIVRLVSKNDYAYLSYADNLYQYINLLSGLGLSTAILKFCSPERSKGENRYFFNVAMRVGVAFQLAISVLLVVIVFIVDIPFPAARPIVLVLVLYPTITQVVTTLQSYIRSQLDNKLYAKMGVVQTLVVFAISVLLATNLGIFGVAIARYVAMAIVIGLGVRFVHKNLPKEIEEEKAPKEEFKFFWKISISMMMANLFSMIMPINEMFLINNYIKDEIISANYKVAILIPSQIVFITSSVVVYLFPKVAQLGKRLTVALKTTVKVEILLFIIITIVCIIGYAITPFLIKYVYGDKYLDAIELSKIYWVVYGLNAGFRMLPMNVLPAIGSTTFNSVTSIVSCIVHAVLLRLLIVRFGIYGAPYSLLIVYAVSGIGYWVYLYLKCSRNLNTQVL